MQTDKIPQKNSMILTSFMTAFRKYLDIQKIDSPQSYLQKVNLSNPTQISKSQFFKICQPLHTALHLGLFETTQLFKELNDGWDYIPVKNFLKVYQDIKSKTPILPTIDSQKSIKEQEKRLNEQKQRKNNLIKISFKKLQQYMLKNNAIELFQECDQGLCERLNQSQFNKLLICTGIKELENKQTRMFVLKWIFSYYPTKQISKEQFIILFKIPKQKIDKKDKIPKVQLFVPSEKVIPFSEPKKPEKKNSPTNPPPQIIIIPPQNKPDHKPQNKPEIKFENKTEKIIEKIPENKPPKMFKKKKIFEVDQKINLLVPTQKNQTIQTNFLFPRAAAYYRNAQPAFQELQYFQILENLLIKKQIYHDNQNPKTPLGRYHQASKFFDGSNYFLFQMAQSVIQRQKSRIGLARQIQPKDIMQGQIGDCYFLSSIASLISIYPEIICQKILFDVNPANYFVVKFFLNGQWRFIQTDDSFPSQNGKVPCFAKPHGRQIWVMLLEKCWAKCYSSYKNIQGGSSKQAFIALTGAPTQYISLKSKQITKQIMQKAIKEAYQNRWVATASGSDFLSSLPSSQQEKIGLVSDHAYSFLKFIDISGEQLVKIRNPWGTRKWTGDWSFESKKWTKQLRDKFNYNKYPQDGSFYMSLSDFLKYFGSLVICKVNPINVHTSLPMQFKRHKSNYVRIKVSQSGRYIFSLYQENQRQMQKKYQNFKFSPSRIILLKELKQNKNLEYINSYQNQSYQTSIQVDLEEKFQYLVSGKFQWTFWETHEGCLTAYGPSKVQFQQIDSSIAPIFKSEMIKGFFNLNRGKTKTYEKIGAIGAYSENFFCIKKGIGYYFITNPSQQEFNLTYTLSGKGIKPIKPDKLPFQFSMKNGSKYLKGFFTSSGGFNYSSSESMSYH